MWRSSSWCSRACLCCQLSNNTSIHQIKPTRVDKLACTPDKVDWISESHGLYNTMLKGSFYNSPWWAWDDGYGLLLGVNVTGLGPLQVHGVTFFAICQHWVGTKPWWGLGQRTPGPPKKQQATDFREKVGEVRNTNKCCRGELSISTSRVQPNSALVKSLELYYPLVLFLLFHSRWW